MSDAWKREKLQENRMNIGGRKVSRSRCLSGKLSVRWTDVDTGENERVPTGTRTIKRPFDVPMSCERETFPSAVGCASDV